MDNHLDRASYLLLIEPEKKVAFRVEKLRDAIHSEVNMVANPFFIPRIPIFDFFQKESEEKRFISLIERFIAELSPFNLRLSNFDSSEHAFYIPVKPIAKELKTVFVKRGELRGITGVSVNVFPTFHLTLFKDLSDDLKTDISVNWKDKKFEDSFLVKEMVLLRKKSQQRHYLEIARFQLLGKKAQATYIQGNLFE